MSAENSLWLIRNNEPNNEYDVFMGAVVVAGSEAVARHIYPGSPDGEVWYLGDVEHAGSIRDAWTNDPVKVGVVWLGFADRSLPTGVVLASFYDG